MSPGVCNCTIGPPPFGVCGACGAIGAGATPPAPPRGIDPAFPPFRWERREGVVVDCAACKGTGLRQNTRTENDGSLLCEGCNGAGKQLLAMKDAPTAVPTSEGAA